MGSSTVHITCIYAFQKFSNPNDCFAARSSSCYETSRTSSELYGILYYSDIDISQNTVSEPNISPNYFRETPPYPLTDIRS
jgi:hypothetical protein